MGFLFSKMFLFFWLIYKIYWINNIIRLQIKRTKQTNKQKKKKIWKNTRRIYPNLNGDNDGYNDDDDDDDDDDGDNFT